MTGAKFKQLNPFELKSVITELLNKLNSVSDIQNCLADFDMLDSQTDKKIISKVLFKELICAPAEKIPVICFLLEHFIPKEELISKFWETLKNQNLQTETKITIINLLRELDADWSYDNCSEYLEDTDNLLDENTKQLLNTAIINPEVQIDFLDFMATIRVQDKITLINSLSEDFSSDALANILIPLFVSNPDSPEGKEALKLLADTKSELALHVLEEMKNLATGELLQEIKRSLSTIKISGTRVDNTAEFYKRILSDSKPDKFYVTYPDGRGDCAMIFTRVTKDNKVRFVSIVINILSGIKDCFGFFEISQFECEKILERFLKNEKPININPEFFKTILHNAEMITIKNNQNKWKLPYEYVCWKNLLIDIDFDSEKIEDILEEQVVPAKVDFSSLDFLTKNNISEHWFLDSQYSNEFISLLKDLKTSTDLEKVVDDNFEKIFDEQEKNDWIKRLELSAYINFANGEDNTSSIIFGISKDERVFSYLLNQILKRSIYEFLTVVKYDKNIDSFALTHDEIEDKIHFIEDKWVKNV